MSQDNINTIINILIIPILPILATFIVSFFKAKTAEVKSRMNNAELSKYLDLLSNSVYTAVDSISQTTVDTLKKSGEFNTEAQQKVLSDAKVMALNILGETAVSALNSLNVDLDALITAKIEAYIKSTK